MNPILLWWKILHLRFQLHHLQNVADFPGNVVYGAAFQLFIDFTPEREIVRHTPVRREKGSVCEDDPALMQEFFTEQSLIDILTVEPDG